MGCLESTQNRSSRRNDQNPPPVTAASESGRSQETVTTTQTTRTQQRNQNGSRNAQSSKTKSAPSIPQNTTNEQTKQVNRKVQEKNMNKHELLEKVHQLEGQNKILCESSENANRKLIASKAEIAEATNKLHNVDKDIKQLRQNNNKIEEEHELLKTGYNKSIEETDRLNTQLKETKFLLKKSEEEKDNVNSQNEENKMKVQEKDNKINELSGELRAIKDEIQGLKAKAVLSISEQRQKFFENQYKMEEDTPSKLPVRKIENLPLREKKSTTLTDLQVEDIEKINLDTNPFILREINQKLEVNLFEANEKIRRLQIKNQELAKMKQNDESKFELNTKFEKLSKENEKLQGEMKEHEGKHFKLKKEADIEINQYKIKIQELENELEKQKMIAVEEQNAGQYNSENTDKKLQDKMKENEEKYSKLKEETDKRIEEYKTKIEALEKELEKQKEIVAAKQNAEEDGFETTDLPDEKYVKESIEKIEKIMENSKQYENDIKTFIGTATDKSYLHIEEMLIRNLMKLDNVESEGSAEIRKERKIVLQYTQKCLDDLKKKVAAQLQNSDL